MTQSLDIHVDESTEAMARRFIDAWHRAERGEAVDEHHLSFESWEGLASVLTPQAARAAASPPSARRSEHRRAGAGARARLQARARGCRGFGGGRLIDRTPAGLRADYGEIRARIAV